MQQKVMFVLGANGFIGKEVVRQARASGWTVKGLVRNESSGKALLAQGAVPVIGDASAPDEWIDAARRCDVLVDLVQPKVQSRLTRKAVAKISAERQALTASLLSALERIPETERPQFFYISGTEDLAPDADHWIGSQSKLSPTLSGFGHIGIPVRRLIEASGVAATFICLGLVYGPGKAFADSILPQIAGGKWRNVAGGTNRLPLVHVEDAARGIVHLAGLERARLQHATFVLADPSASTAQAVFAHAADLLGAKPPGSAPAWLASLIAGCVSVQTITQDLRVDPKGLFETGFSFKYPSHREGLPPTLAALGYAVRPVVD